MMDTNVLDSIDKAMSSGAKSIFSRDSQPGDVAEGYILDVQYRQTLEYGTQTPATFPSGDPKMQTILTIQTENQDDADDDGTRSVYIKMWGTQKRALADAIKRAGATKASEIIQKGNYFKATYLGEERKQGKGGSYMEKQYQYELRKANFDVDAALAANATHYPQQQQPQSAGNPWNETPQTQPQQPAQPPVQQPLQQPAQPQATRPDRFTPPQPVATNPAEQGQMETKIAQMIGIGMSDQQIAMALGIDPNTVATYR